jgi:hypothetical protein
VRRALAGGAWGADSAASSVEKRNGNRKKSDHYGRKANQRATLSSNAALLGGRNLRIGGCDLVGDESGPCRAGHVR